MRKLFALSLLTAVVLLPIGCSGFKGFCSRGSLFPSTRQQSISAPVMGGETVVYECASAEMCCPNVCDPCCTSTVSSGMSPTYLPGPQPSQPYYGN